MPGPSYRADLYGSYVSTTHRKGASEEEYRRRGQAYEHRVRRFLPADKAAFILDLACGAGEFLFWLKSLGYTGALGIDISAEQLAEGRTRGVENTRHEDLFAHLRGHAGAYDFILASHVVEHLPKAELLDGLRLIRQALRAGGRALVLCPNAGSPLGLQAQFGDLTHETALTGLSLAQAASAAGLGIVHLGGIRPRGLLKGLLWSALVRPVLAGLSGGRVRYGDIVEPELIGLFGKDPSDETVR